MNLDMSPEDEAFRQEVVDFLDAEWTEDFAHTVSDQGGLELKKDGYVEWHKTLYKKGWIAPGWPKEYGGPGWTATQRYIFTSELALAGAVPPLAFNIVMVGPVIYTFGSEEQKKRFLEPTLSCDTWWCQGYSEPGSGSDLASLRTKAVRDGDDYVVNGSKIWTTMAHNADWIFCLVRTDSTVKQQAGISFLLIDMKTPGVTVRPIHTLGGAHEVNEVFFDNVRVPAENLVGEENKGWTYAKYLLTHERTAIFPANENRRALNVVKTYAADDKLRRAGQLPIDDPFVQKEIAELECKILAQEMTGLRALEKEVREGQPGPESSILKILGTEIKQRIDTLGKRVIGSYALPHLRDDSSNTPFPGPDEAANAFQNYLSNRASTIYGGSNEVQRNIIAKNVLGL